MFSIQHLVESSQAFLTGLVHTSRVCVYFTLAPIYIRGQGFSLIGYVGREFWPRKSLGVPYTTTTFLRLVYLP